MIAGVLGDTEDVWTAIFRTMNRQYPPPKLVLFTGAVQSACGRASASSGPFYCGGDRKLYLDTAFFNELAQRFGAPGQFAQAYVIAHEVGHHVQNLLGTMQQVDARQARASERDRNALSVRLELQADCYAGVWGFYAAKRNLLDPGDLADGLRAAAAVGDDQIQKRMQGYVNPESFTHGTAAQRTTWFKRGFDTGDIRNCDTFSAQ
jgi:predicted metalloprotease